MSEAQKITTLRTAEAEPALLDQIVARMSEVVHRAAPAVQPMELRSFDELERWAERASRSTMVPPSYKGKPDDIMLAVQMGSELGLRPMQALQNIATINGRPAVWGDAMLALCMGHPLYRGVAERIEGEGENRTAHCIAQRQGDAPKPGKFSMADAKRAGLLGKAGPWTQYPDRMLQMRARGFALRDAFPDKLRGLISAEEAGDYTLESAGISAAPPAAEPEPPKRTLGQFLDYLETELRDAADYAAVVALVEHPDTRRAQDVAKNGMAQRLADMIDAATARVTAVKPAAEDDGWPGPDTEGAE